MDIKHCIMTDDLLFIIPFLNNNNSFIDAVRTYDVIKKVISNAKILLTLNKISRKYLNQKDILREDIICTMSKFGIDATLIKKEMHFSFLHHALENDFVSIQKFEGVCLDFCEEFIFKKEKKEKNIIFNKNNFYEENVFRSKKKKFYNFLRKSSHFFDYIKAFEKNSSEKTIRNY